MYFLTHSGGPPLGWACGLTPNTIQEITLVKKIFLKKKTSRLLLTHCRTTDNQNAFDNIGDLLKLLRRRERIARRFFGWQKLFFPS